MRIVDLSKKLYPGKEQRRCQIWRFTYASGEYMHYIDLESHVGTHVEAPSHYIPARYGRPAEDVSELPLERLMGEAVFWDLSGVERGKVLKPEDVEVEIREGDIVLVGNSPYRGPDRPQFSEELIRWLVDKKIKLIGVDDSVIITPRSREGLPEKLEDLIEHELFLGNGIPIVEQLTNLDKLRRKRFLFIGFPLNISGLDSSPIRAVAIEDAKLIEVKE